jgi:RNA polymerase sigma-70 factor (ECF subfamily)
MGRSEGAPRSIRSGFSQPPRVGSRPAGATGIRVTVPVALSGLSAKAAERKVGFEQGGHLERTADDADLERLLGRVAARDEEAFADLYRFTSAKLFGVVSRILPAKAAASDALQDAYLRIWERASDFDASRGRPLAWMATIARNRALDEVRRVRPAALDDMPAGFEPAAESVEPMASRERSETLAQLLACLGKLDEARRQAILMAYYRGASRAALAQRFGRPEATIKTWLRRGLAQLRDCLAS